MVKDTAAIASFKSWIFPGLVSILGMMIWNDVNEIKSDVKVLMAQSNVDKTRIDNLERQLFKATSTPNDPARNSSDHASLVAILPDNKYKTLKYEF
jgi:hypothetical protein